MSNQTSNEKTTGELQEFSESFLRFSRRNSSWWYLFLIMILLFGVVYLYNTVNNRTKSPAETYREEYIQLKERVEAQELSIKQLEEQVKQLQAQQ